MPALWTELKRRNVFRVGVAYLALAWVVIQITDLAVPALNLPESLHSIVFYIGMVGFPFALFFAWAFELTPDGLKREKEVDRSQSVTHATGRKLDFAIIGMLLVAISFLVVDNYVLEGEEGVVSSDPAADETLAVESQSYDSIGVLPFANMSNDPEQDYFSDGMAEELLNALAKLQNLQVAARTSSFAFKGKNMDITEIGNTLKVDTMLEGSVRKSGTRLRITAQLIDVANGYHLWSETYDRELTDVFEIQDELTSAIVAALKVHLAVGETTERAATVDNWEAYDAYLKGLHAIRKRTDESTSAAIGYFQEAVRLDPEFAAALAQQAQAVLLSVSYGGAPKEEAAAKGKALLSRALSLNPELAEGYAARGYLAMEAGNCSAALPDFEKARTLNPNLVEALHWSSICLGEEGRLTEALQLSQRAHQLDPLHAAVFTVLTNFETQFGMEVEINREAAQRNNPYRFLQYQSDLLLREKKWAEAFALSIPPGAPEDALFLTAVASVFLAQDDTDLFDRATNASGTTDHFLKLASLMVFRHFDEMEQYLASLSDTDLTWASTGAWHGHIQYLRGEAADAEPLLLKAVIDENQEGNLNFPLSQLNLTISLADVLNRNGKAEQADTFIKLARSKVDTLIRNGAAFGYQFAEARLSILEGDNEKALSLLQKADESGQLLWANLNEPIISRLQHDPDFIEFKASYYDYLNAERAKMNWPPVVPE
ncbi:MAG: hypothetical protein ABJN62_03225 [Halioglobus sp.]